MRVAGIEQRALAHALQIDARLHERRHPDQRSRTFHAVRNVAQPRVIASVMCGAGIGEVLFVRGLSSGYQ